MTVCPGDLNEVGAVAGRLLEANARMLTGIRIGDEVGWC